MERESTVADIDLCSQIASGSDSVAAGSAIVVDCFGTAVVAVGDLDGSLPVEYLNSHLLESVPKSLTGVLYLTYFGKQFQWEHAVQMSWQDNSIPVALPAHYPCCIAHLQE